MGKRSARVLYVDRNTYYQILMDVFLNWIVNFVQNTRKYQKISVKTINYKKVAYFFIVFFSTIIISLCFNISKIIILNAVFLYYSICLFIKFFFYLKGFLSTDNNQSAFFLNDEINDNTNNDKIDYAVITSLYKDKSVEIRDSVETFFPIYTILIPMYKENIYTVTQVVDSIKKIDYPIAKLDVKLVLEEDDVFMKQVIQNVALPGYIDIIWCPSFQPKTKPKACNIASLFARGDIIVIYDAEDCVDTNQLLNSLNTFSIKKDISITQGCLSFYNSNQNLLTTCFNIEYLIYFKLFLKQLSSYNITIPLGGTSNHIKYDFLRKNGFWDSYHVTEDLELSYISLQNNEKILHLDCDTKEWCVVDIKSFIKQRVRWMKGYLLTYFLIFFDRHQYVKCSFIDGIKKQIFYHIMVGYTTLCFLFSPLMFYEIFSGSMNNDIILLFFFANISYYISNILSYIYICRKEYMKITPLTVLGFIFYPLYFILHFISTYIAIIDIIRRPFYWSKTEHKNRY